MPRRITIIEAVSQASMEIGITQAPVTQAVGTLDQDIAQMVALLSAVAGEVLDDEPYEETLGDGYWLLDIDSQTKKAAPTKDTDIILFDPRLAIAGLKFMFLKAKGLEFGEELRAFTVKMNKLAARANRRVLDLNEEAERIQ
jgi:hypothetical protein